MEHSISSALPGELQRRRWLRDRKEIWLLIYVWEDCCSLEWPCFHTPCLSAGNWGTARYRPDPESVGTQWSSRVTEPQPPIMVNLIWRLNNEIHLWGSSGADQRPCQYMSALRRVDRWLDPHSTAKAVEVSDWPERFFLACCWSFYHLSECRLHTTVHNPDSCTSSCVGLSVIQCRASRQEWFY